MYDLATSRQIQGRHSQIELKTEPVTLGLCLIELKTEPVTLGLPPELNSRHRALRCLVFPIAHLLVVVLL
jgi:hypothetical protein